ncbi:Peroxisomal sarcosine oxidase, partial [Paramuricea clavata]
MEDCPYTTLNQILANFKANGITNELLNAKQLKEKYNFDFPASVKGLFERTGGILLANKCLRALQDQFVKFGGVLHDSEKVLEIMPGDIVKVKTNKGCYRTNKLILTPGPWAPSLLKSLG